MRAGSPTRGVSQTNAQAPAVLDTDPSTVRPPPPYVADRAPRRDREAGTARQLASARVRSIWTRFRPPVRIELVCLAGLLVLTGAFGRTFSKLEFGFSWLHVTEVVLIAVLVTAVIRTPWRAWSESMRRTGVAVPVLIFWLLGTIAAVRGLTSWGFSPVLHDIGLLEYSVLIPLIVLLVHDRNSLVWMCRAVAVAGLLGILLLAVTSWSPHDWNLSELDLIAAASGMYASIYVAWVLARRSADLPVAVWQYAAVIVASGLIVVGSARSAWLALLVVFACAAVLATRGRIAFAGQLACFLVVGTTVATVAQEARTLGSPDVSALAAKMTAIASVAETAPVPHGTNTPARAPEVQPPSNPVAGAETERAETASTSASARVPIVGAVAAEGGSPGSEFMNPGMESGTLRGYIGFPPNTLAASRERAASGKYALKAVYEGDPRLAKTLTYLPLDPTTRYAASAEVYVPRSWDGGPITISTDRTWSHASESTAGSSTDIRGEWTRVVTVLEPDARDTIGAIHIRAGADSRPSTGSAVYVDDVTIKPIGASSAQPAHSAPAKPAEGPPPAEQPEPSQGDGATAPEPTASGLDELAASFRPSSEQANADWRLAFWTYIVEQTASNPLVGVGFGTPANFEWNGIRYDGRTGDASDPFDVSGPHNSFLNILYRTGVPGFLALCAILLIAFIRLIPVARDACGTDKAIAVWLVAGLAGTVVLASFNVALEGPFMGIFFWTILGLALIAPRLLGRDRRHESPM